MKFEKLFNLVTEAGFRPSAPKNMGGARIHNAMESDPTQMVNAGDGKFVGKVGSSSVGRNDNPEAVVPISRWEFNPYEYNISKDGKLDIKKRGDIGAAAGSMMYASFTTSFGLLANDPTFITNFNKLATSFGKQRASYGLSRTVEDFRGREVKEAYDYEKKLDNLNFMKVKRAEEVTELQTRLRHYRVRVNDYEKYNSSPTKFNQLRELYAEISARVKAIEDNNKKSKNTHFFDIHDMYREIETKTKLLKNLNHEILLTKDVTKVKNLNSNISTISDNISSLTKKINSKKYEKALPEVKRYRSAVRRKINLEDKHTNANLSSSAIVREKAKILDLIEEIEVMEEKYRDVVNDLKNVEDHINQINAINEKVDKETQIQFIDEVNSSARRIIKDLQVPKEKTVKDFSQISWSGMPSSNNDKIDKLLCLTSEDPNINPFIGYLERFQRAYDNREYVTSLQLDRNANITSVRDFEKLPFSIILNVFKGVSTKPIQLKSKEYDESKSDVWDTLSEYLLAFKGMKGDELFDSVAAKFKSPRLLEIVPSLTGLKVRDVWINKLSKDLIRELINELGLPESFKMRHILVLASPKPMDISGGNRYNSFMRLYAAIKTDIDGTKVKVKESFDKMFEKLINEKVWDDDDFKLDTMEVLSYYK
jgi:hypothetical protein